MTNPNQPGSYNQGAPKKEPREEEMKSKKNPNDREDEEVSDESPEEEAE